MRLAGKRAVVTGSTKGIGLGIARAFVREGARDEASFVTGEVLTVDGGWSAYGYLWSRVG